MTKVIIELGKDNKGEFIQHHLEMEGTATTISRQYYKIVDKALVENMPQKTLEDLVAKGVEELEKRTIAKHPNLAMADSQHLRFLYKRLVHKHRENPNYDYMIRFNKIIEQVEQNDIEDLFGDGSQFKGRR